MQSFTGFSGISSGINRGFVDNLLQCESVWRTFVADFKTGTIILKM
jgi:hypothetical protein